MHNIFTHELVIVFQTVMLQLLTVFGNMFQMVLYVVCD